MRIEVSDEKNNAPILPAIVLFGLIFVNLGPLNFFPKKYPPMSEEIQINKIVKIIIFKL